VFFFLVSRRNVNLGVVWTEPVQFFFLGRVAVAAFPPPIRLLSAIIPPSSLFYLTLLLLSPQSLFMLPPTPCSLFELQPRFFCTQIGRFVFFFLQPPVPRYPSRRCPRLRPFFREFAVNGQTFLNLSSPFLPSQRSHWAPFTLGRGTELSHFPFHHPFSIPIWLPPPMQT